MSQWDVFVSYSGADEAVAAQFAQELVRRGKRVFCTALPPSKSGPWNTVVAEALTSAPVAYVLVGKKSPESSGQLAEIRALLAQQKKRKLELWPLPIVDEWPSPAELDLVWQEFSGFIRIAHHPNGPVAALPSEDGSTYPIPWQARPVGRPKVAAGALLLSAAVGAFWAGWPHIRALFEGDGKPSNNGAAHDPAPVRTAGSIAAAAEVRPVTLVLLPSTTKDEDGSLRDMSACERRSEIVKLLEALAPSKPAAAFIDLRFHSQGCPDEEGLLASAVLKFRKHTPHAALLAARSDSPPLGTCPLPAAQPSAAEQPACFDALLTVEVPWADEDKSALAPTFETCAHQPHFAWMLAELRLASAANGGSGDDSLRAWVARKRLCTWSKTARLRGGARFGVAPYQTVRWAPGDSLALENNHVVVVGFLYEPASGQPCPSEFDSYRVNGLQGCVPGVQLLVEAALMYDMGAGEGG
jgi:hypothetical protein